MSRRRRTVKKVRQLYWHVLPVGDEETKEVMAFFRSADHEAQYALSPSKSVTVRVPQRIITREELMEEFPGLGVVQEDRFAFMHKEWTKLKSSSQ